MPAYGLGAPPDLLDVLFGGRSSNDSGLCMPIRLRAKARSSHYRLRLADAGLIIHIVERFAPDKARLPKMSRN